MSQGKQNGFTLIELILSMGFVSALLIAIALTVIQIGNTYTRGLTLKEVDQAGRSLSAELQRVVSQSATFNVSGTGSVFIDETWGGRLCVGQYSYVWNYGETINDTSPSAIKNFYASPATYIDIRFVRVTDAPGLMCKVDPATSLLPNVPIDQSVELLGAGDRSLALHDFAINSIMADSRTSQQLYKISFIIGTNEQALIDTANNNCKAPDIAGTSKTDMSYCSINRFELVVRSGNVAG